MSSEKGGCLLPADELRRLLEGYGVSRHRAVFVCTQRQDLARIAGARLVWILTLLGCETVLFVDGGIEAWRARDLEVSDEPHKWHGPPGDLRGDLCEEVRATTADVEAVVASGIGLLGDARSWEEYVGKRHDYAYFDALGRIPGAKWARWGRSTYVGGDFWTNRGGQVRGLEEVRAWWEEAGLCPACNGAPLIFYCGTGWRSAYAWLIARLLGWEAKNYDGGFLQWSTLDPCASQHGIERGVVLSVPGS